METVQTDASFEDISLFLENAGDAFESVLIQEPGKREIEGGVKSLHTDKIKGNLWKSVENILSDNVKNIVLLVGSTSSMIMWPPTDTDGPGGAFALGNTLVRMGKKVIVVCDSVNHDQVFPALQKSRLWLNHNEREDKVEYISLNSANVNENEQILEDLFKKIDHIINVGRPGPDASGVYWSHDLRQMTHYQPDFPILFEMAENSKGGHKEVWTTAIGELGNELGMGEIQPAVNLLVSDGKKLACPIKADFTIVSTVVNWGAFGMSCLLTLGYIARTESERYSPIQDFLPSKNDQEVILTTLVEEESRCGVTMTRDKLIDNFSADENWDFLEKLHGMARSFNVDMGSFFEKAVFAKKRQDNQQKPAAAFVVTA